MAATLNIKIQGKPDVDANTSRNDAAPGDVVTVQLGSPADPPDFRIVWTPKGGMVTPVIESSNDGTTARFTVPAGAYGTYRFRYIDANAEEIIRELAVLTPNRALRIPPLGSKGSKDAGVEYPNYTMVEECENNAAYPDEPRLDDTSGQNFTGYALDLEKLFLTVDALAGTVADLGEEPGGGVPQALLDQVADHEARLVDLEEGDLDSRLDTLETWRSEIAPDVEDLEARMAGVEAIAAGTSRLIRQFANEAVTGTAAYNMGAMYFRQGERLPATARTLLGAAGGTATFEIVDEATSNVVATASTSAALAAVAFAGGEVTFPTTGIYSMRLRGSAANTAASFRGIDWTVTT